MRGKDCNLHPASVLGKKRSPCGRTDGAVEVEDHGNGYMFIGCSDIEQARRILDDYVDNAGEHRFAGRTVRMQDNGHWACCVWLSTHPGAVWDGAVDPMGNPLPR